MTHPFDTSKWRQLLLALVFGTAAAAVIWIAGAPDQAWLGYVAAGLAWSGTAAGRCLRPNRGSERNDGTMEGGSR